MDAAPRAFADLPIDAELKVPIPFACGTATGYGDRDLAPSARHLDKRRVTQCALSRICGVCGSSLGRPIVFLGSPQEADRNAFHFPPSHLKCAESLLAAYAGVNQPALGQSDAEPWVLVTTASFEFVRADREDTDHRPTFQPHTILNETGER